MKTTWLRAGLLLLASAPLVVGMWALLVPHSFYDDFPLPGRDWVSTLGPTTSTSCGTWALNLALGVLLASAAILLERRLARVSLLAWVVYAVPHFVFHLGTDHAVSLADNVANMVSLGIAVLLSLILLLGSRGGEQTPRAKNGCERQGG